MRPCHGIGRTRCVGVLLLLGLSARAVVGQPNPPPPRAETAGPATTSPGTPVREQTIYIPYTKLRELFEREGRGVFLPYEQFQELWKAAREGTRTVPTAGPPVAAVITEAAHVATIGRDVVSVQATVHIELLKPGWQEIALRLGDAAITSATVGGVPARILGGAPDGYRLLVEKRGEGPETLELKLEYGKAFAKSPGQNSVAFEVPLAPVSRWRVRIPEAGVKLNIRPLIAATEVPSEPAASQPNETELLAFVGAVPTVELDWTPRAEGAQGLQALQTVEAVQRLMIDEGVIRTRVQLNYDISRAAVEHLAIEVPADQKVVSVFDANVRQWAVAAQGESQTVTIDLFQPARGRQGIVIELERFDEQAVRPEFKVPVVRALDVQRQQGVVAVALGEGLRVEPLRRSGLLQVDAAEVSAAAGDAPPAGGWALCYRYAAVPFDLALSVVPIEPSIVADALVTARVLEDLVDQRVQIVYAIEKAGLFRLELEIPEGYEIHNLRGAPVAGATAAVVESHAVNDGPSRRLVVNLGRKALGRTGLELNLRTRVSDPNLQTPTGKAASVALSLPRVVGPGVEQFTGRLIVQSAESLRTNPGATEGLRQITLAEAQTWAGMPPQAPGKGEPRPETAAAGLAYAFGTEPAAITLKVERRKPYVTVRQLLIVRIEAGLVQYDATFAYKIEYSAVPSLRIDVPSDLVGRLQNRSAGLREAVLEQPTSSAAEGYTPLVFRGETGPKGDVTVRLTWEARTDALDIGQSATIMVPRLQPAETDRAWGQIALAKAETIDIRATGGPGAERPIGLRPIDPQHDLQDLPETVKADSIARAFEFHDAWTLGVTASRYKLEEVKRTSIERGLVRMVVTRSGLVAAQALYRVRSALQRLPITLPPGATFDTDPVRINGRPAALERGQQDELFVPLVGQNPDQPFVLELRYTVPNTGTRLVCPDFPSQPAVQKVYLVAYLPREQTLLGARGPWTDEIGWRWNELRGFEPLPPSGDLIGWVTADIPLPTRPGDTFQVDGQPYVFWALQPVPPPAGALALVAVHEHVLAGALFAIIIGAGLLLLRARVAGRLLAMGALALVLILAGVFWPIFARQIANGPFFSALAAVAVLWAVWYGAWTRPRRRRVPPVMPAPVSSAPLSESSGGEPHA